ncbi:MAG: (Fe-S)-binding protein [Campylobacteraceae bacterium]|jgi:glycolate oxidase iron-sulfur subunit|nr:(Fe-S)-binding protein [Campylobacteraceae bacterium]
MNFDFTKASEACVKCGKCVPSCTIHKINSDEVTSPRGFLELVGAYQRGELELDKNTKDIFEKCFLCTTCVSICPTSLPTDLAIENIRFKIAEKFGIAWFKRVYFFLLRHRRVMDFSFSFLSVFLPVLFKIDRETESMKPRLSLPFVKKRVFPLLNKRSFLQKHKGDIKNGSDTKKIALFVGCFSNYHYTKTADSLLEILKVLKINVFIPPKQRCCGAPAFFTGDFKTVDRLIKQNVEYFETFIDDVDAIIVPEATCAAMIKEDWGRFMQEQPEWLARVTKITSKVFMASEWLYAKTDLAKHLKALYVEKKSVTYHDPCHARKVLKIFKEPRALLSENYELIEMSDPNQCCGFGGVTIQSEKFELAKNAAKPKVEMIKQTGAKILSAECGACRMQLSNALDKDNVKIVFSHPLELIAKAIRENKKSQATK